MNKRSKEIQGEYFFSENNNSHIPFPRSGLVSDNDELIRCKRDKSNKCNRKKSKKKANNEPKTLKTEGFMQKHVIADRHFQKVFSSTKLERDDERQILQLR